METLAQDLRTMVRTPLTEAHVAAMRRVGQEETLSAGETLFRTGDVQDRFMLRAGGEVAALDPVTGQRYGDATLGPGQFFGEISFLWGGALMLGAVAVQDTRLLCRGAR
jgi:thioredoxin reductase (NADPH)